MGFQNQFSLSLELTRLLPPIKWPTDKTVDAITTRARDLSNSGSDISVEEDLARVFGRCRISDALTSSFKTVVTKSTSSTPILEAIMLQAGPGPTVIRALQDSHYFATVVQLSLLVWTFSASNLATAIADALRERSEGAPSTSGLQSTPSRVGILGVLRACESQTSAFNWNMMLNAVSTVLGYGTDPARTDFPAFMLRGLLDMLPMVQTLPNDRFIHIQIPVSHDVQSGTCALIVWAHHVLGLTVFVILRGGLDGSPTRNFRFGASDLEQVLIEEVATDNEARLTILDSHKEHLLTIKPVPDGDDALIGSIERVPARGWGNTLFSDFFRRIDEFRPDCLAIVSDMRIVTTAFAFLVAKHLFRDTGNRDHGKEARYSLAYSVDEERLLEASRFLFDSPHIRRGEVENFVAHYKSKALDGNLPWPPSFAACWEAYPQPADRAAILGYQWSALCDYTRRVAIFLIALAHVTNLEDCEDLMFARAGLRNMKAHSVVRQLEDWTGDTALYIKDKVWLQALAVPLISHQDHVLDLPWDRICLVSDKGWSAWISTLGNTDPTYTSAGSVRIGKGSPCRNGIWKSGIWDSMHHHNFIRIWKDSEIAESCGQVASLRCSRKVSLENPYCGEGDDVFLVCARLRVDLPEQHHSIHRIGYKQLESHHWKAHLSRRCSHRSQSGNEITLGMDIATIAGFGYSDARERILIYLTAHSIGARWLGLAMSSLMFHTEISNSVKGPERQILLRGNDCCFQCTIDQVAAQPGKWLIIL